MTYKNQFAKLLQAQNQEEQSQIALKELKLIAWDWVTEKLLRANLMKWVSQDVQQQMKSLTVKPFDDPQTGAAKMYGANYKRVNENRMIFATDDQNNEKPVFYKEVILSNLLHRLAVSYPTEMILGRGKNGKDGVIGFRFYNLIDPEAYEKGWKDNMAQYLQSVRERITQQRSSDLNE